MGEMHFNENESLLYVKTSGKTSMLDMLGSLKYLSENSNLPRNLKILEDASSAFVVFKEENLIIIINELNNTLKKYTSIKHAVIQTDPLNTSYSFLAKELIKNEKHEFEVFSTLEGAKKWLKVKGPLMPV